MLERRVRRQPDHRPPRGGADLPTDPGHVRIRVAFVGLCGTDLHIVHGSMDRRVQMPLVFGHEMSGTIDVGR